MRNMRPGIPPHPIATPVLAEHRSPGGPPPHAGRRRPPDVAIARLPQLYREVYVLREVEGSPNAEVAARLGFSVSAVKSRLHRAKLLLRKLLDPPFEGDSACRASLNATGSGS
jgi:hypothetical protein